MFALLRRIVLLTKILERMAIDNIAFSDLIMEIPNFMYIKRNSLSMEQKGTVMRSLIEEESKGKRNIELFEGVKVNDEKGWALILPDSDEPICRIYSEGFNEDYAEELAAFYEKKIKEIQTKEGLN